jgi:hypothetical protein
MIAYDGNNGFAARLHNEGWQIDCTLAAAPNGDGLMATFVAFSAS